MNIDLSALTRSLSRAKAVTSVPSDKVNPYLLNVLLRRLLRGEDVTYGEIDLSQFEADDLRTLAWYCEGHSDLSQRLSEFVENMNVAEALHCKARAFC